MIAGLAVRVLLALSVWITSRDVASFTALDTESYVQSAAELVSRGTFTRDGRPEFFRTPGFPLLVSVGIAAQHVYVVTIGLQILLSVATIYLVFALTRLLVPEGRAAILAAGIYAFEPLSILYTSKLLTETLFSFLLAATTYWACVYLRRTDWSRVGWRIPGSLLVAALALAAATFTRPVSILLPLCAALFFAGLALFRRSATTLLHGAVFVALAAAPVSLWSYRNSLVADYPGFTGVSDFNLYFFKAAGVVAVREGRGFADVQREWGWGDSTTYLARHPEQARWSEGARTVWIGEAARRILKADPIVYARLHVAGTVRMLVLSGSEEYLRIFGLYPATGSGLLSRLIDQGYVRTILALMRERPLLFWSNVALTLLLFLTYVFAAYGLVSGRIRHAGPAALLTVLVVVYLVAISGGPDMLARYRHPLMVFLTVFAGAGVARALQLRGRGARAVVEPQTRLAPEAAPSARIGNAATPPARAFMRIATGA